MIKLRATIDVHQVRAGLTALGTQAPVAVMRAINRTLATANTRAVRALSDDMGVAQKHIRPTLRIYRASTRSARGSLEATGRRIPLIQFKARGPEPSRGRGRVTAVSRGQRQVYPSAFIATMRSGRRGVWKRIPNTQAPNAPWRGMSGQRVKRQRIHELYGPSVPHVYAKHIRAGFRAAMTEVLQTNLRHEIGYLLIFGRR